jgi:hypothetical protein
MKRPTQSNPKIAALLLRDYGLSLAFRSEAGFLLRLQPADADCAELLALTWLEGSIALGSDAIDPNAMKRILRRRGCSLR